MEEYWLWFCMNFYQNPAAAACFIEAFGNPRDVFRTTEEKLLSVFPNHRVLITRVCRSRKKWNYESEAGRLNRLGITFVSIENPAYPSRLKKIATPPFGLFVRGRLPNERRISVSVVGARDCTPYGKNVARRFASELAGAGIQIISGMARGIDGAAHRGALPAHGESFAVLGCGADICYPESNRDIYMEMEKGGGIISECPPGVKPLAYLFPQRNRIISGLSDAVLVIEAREKSGSLITADLALEQGRDVYAAPGNLGEPLSLGCNNLIKQGAGILISPEMLLEDLGFLHEINPDTQNVTKNSLESPENPVYSCLSLRAAGLDEICAKTGLGASEVMKELSSLILLGQAKEVSKNRYTLAT